MKEKATALGIAGFNGLDGLLIVGDAGFQNHRVLSKIYEHGFLGAFRMPKALTRTVVGSRQVSRKLADNKMLEATLDVCNDGVHFCDCDQSKHPHLRQPMKQFAGAFGKSPHVYVACENDTCDYFGQRFYIPFRKPDQKFAGGRIELGDIDYTAVSPISRYLKDIELAIWKGCQAVEHYHSQLLAKFGLGITDTKGRRIISGDLRHRWFYLLADIVWNQSILFALEEGFEHTALDRDALWEAMVRNRRQVDGYKRKRAGDVGEADADMKGRSNSAKSKAPPAYAKFVWRTG